MSSRRQFLVELELLASEYAKASQQFGEQYADVVHNVLDAADIMQRDGIPPHLQQLVQRAVALTHSEPAAFGWGMAFGSLVAVAVSDVKRRQVGERHAAG